MPFRRITLAIFALLGILTSTVPAAEQKPVRATFTIVELDSGPEATLGTGDRLYLRISYESPVPVRFVAEAFRQESIQEEAFTSSTPPYDAGSGEALAWLGFARPIRIDELRVTAFDIDWQELGTQFVETVATWEERENQPPRQPAAWVEPLLKHHRHVFDNTFDPQPQKPAPLFDALFLLSFMAMPLYLLMQLQMLIRYRGRWQWYATVPLLPIVPLALYSLLGLGLSTELWIIFLFRYMTVALIYLAILWVVKWRKDRESEIARRQAPAGQTS